jgi:hypothetical protein
MRQTQHRLTRPAKYAIRLAAVFALAGCAEIETPTLPFDDYTPISAVAINQNTVTPALGSTVSRGASRTYSVDVDADFRTDEVTSPRLRLFVNAGHFNSSDTFVTDCGNLVARDLTVSTSGEPVHATGTFAVPSVLQCPAIASATVLRIRVEVWDANTFLGFGHSLFYAIQ